jgi:hypothetical protein
MLHRTALLSEIEFLISNQVPINRVVYDINDSSKNLATSGEFVGQIYGATLANVL